MFYFYFASNRKLQFSSALLRSFAFRNQNLKTKCDYCCTECLAMRFKKGNFNTLFRLKTPNLWVYCIIMNSKSLINAYICTQQQTLNMIWYSLPYAPDTAGQAPAFCTCSRTCTWSRAYMFLKLISHVFVITKSRNKLKLKTQFAHTPPPSQQKG